MMRLASHATVNKSNEDSEGQTNVRFSAQETVGKRNESRIVIEGSWRQLDIKKGGSSTSLIRLLNLLLYWI